MTSHVTSRSYQMSLYWFFLQALSKEGFATRKEILHLLNQNFFKPRLLCLILCGLSRIVRISYNWDLAFNTRSY